MLPCHTGLGVRIVLIIGARQQIDELLEKQGEAPQYAAGYRITDSVAMQTAVQAAGASRMAVEAQLSKVNNPTPITKSFVSPNTTRNSLVPHSAPRHHTVVALPDATSSSATTGILHVHFFYTFLILLFLIISTIAVAMQTATPFDRLCMWTLLLRY